MYNCKINSVILLLILFSDSLTVLRKIIKGWRGEVSLAPAVSSVAAKLNEIFPVVIKIFSPAFLPAITQSAYKMRMGRIYLVFCLLILQFYIDKMFHQLGTM